jgi:hypothetical protein
MGINMYENIRDTLDTGDLLLYSGVGPVSMSIRLVTRSKWSHIGVVIRPKDFDMVCVLQSTTLSKSKDVISGTEVEGVQINLLSESLRDYKGDVAVRKLGVERTDDMRDTISNFRREVHGRPYEERKMELLKSAYDFFGGANAEDLSSLFCSELVAELYQRIGLLSEEKPSNEYTPKDFAGNVPLLGSATLYDVVYIKK